MLHLDAPRNSDLFHGVQGVPSLNLGVPTNKTNTYERRKNRKNGRCTVWQQKNNSTVIWFNARRETFRDT